jgi:predicted phosphodiesterase
MSTLAAEVAALAKVGPSAHRPERARAIHPRGWEPGVKYATDGTRTVTTTVVPEVAGDGYAALLAELGQNVPAGWRARLAEARYDPVAWTRDTPDQGAAVTRPAWRYRFVIEPEPFQNGTPLAPDVDALVALIGRHKPRKAAPSGESALVVCLSDWQLGKPDGDGTAGIVGRVLASVDAVTDRAKELRRSGRTLGSLYVIGLGDLIEGCDGHYAMQAYGVELNLVEQVRVVRRLLVKALTTWAPLFGEVVVACVPGNHGENRKDGKAFTDWSDNHDVAVFEQAAAVIEANPAAYGHVSFCFPEHEDLTLTLDIAGTVVALAHGHQMKTGKAHEWWAKQAHGLQPAGDATLLLAGHLHHLLVDQAGAKTFIQAPALDGGSTWWKHTTGQDSPPGVLTLVVGPAGWDDLKVL